MASGMGSTMGNGDGYRRGEPERHKVSVLVLGREHGWAAEVAVRCGGQLKAYWRNEEAVYPTRDAARLAGYQWAEDYLHSLAPAGPEGS